MTRLGYREEVRQLARDLGIAHHGDCLPRIVRFAMQRVDELVDGFDARDLDTLRSIVANRLSICLEFIHYDDDIERIVDENRGFSILLPHQLREEFIVGETEGLLLRRDSPADGELEYLAVIDARGERSVRAYFTSWHEIAHMLIQPQQLPIPGLRRTRSIEYRSKDPVESVVDAVAGRVGFYPPIFSPVLAEAMATHGGLTFDAIEQARIGAAPSASLFASALGSISIVEYPAALVTMNVALKAKEQRAMASLQQELELGLPRPVPSLRVDSLIWNHLDAKCLDIHRKMRVPGHSVLSAAYDSDTDICLTAEEDQSWWETSTRGPLPNRPLKVSAMRRGRYVYGLFAVES